MDKELLKAIQARRPTKKHDDSTSTEEADDGDGDGDGDGEEGEGQEPEEESESEGSPKEGSRIRSSAFRRLKQQWATVEEEIGGVPLPPEWKKDQDDEEGESGSSSRGAQPEPEPEPDSDE